MIEQDIDGQHRSSITHQQAPRDVAEVIGQTLRDLGVDTMFGLLGSGNFVTAHAFAAAGGRVVHSRHENAAVAMADGFARVSGRLGVASVHTGPGLTNATTAIAEAAKSHTPLLVLAGDVPAASGPTNFRIDQHGVVEAVGAVAHRVHAPDSAVADVVRAVQRAEVERRPVVLMMATDIQAMAAADPSDLPSRPVPPAPPAPDPAAIHQIADLVEAAQRPVIVAGRGAVISEAREPLETLGSRIGALTATTAVANGLFRGLAFDVGISGGFATPLAGELLQEADLVLAFGAALNGWTTRHGKMFPSDVTYVQVDTNPSAIGVYRPVHGAAVADASLAAIALERELQRRGFQQVGYREPETRLRISRRRRWRDEPHAVVHGAAMDPRTISITVDDLLPADRQVVTDSGTYIGFPATYLEVAEPRAFVFPNAFMSVGLGLAAAIGAATARPERVTVAALGDCGALMSLGELETLRRAALPILVLVYDDASAGAEYQHYGPQGYALDLVCWDPVNFAATAQALGVRAVTAHTPEDLGVIGEWAADPDGPLLVDARMSRDAAPGPWMHEAIAKH